MKTIRDIVADHGSGTTPPKEIDEYWNATDVPWLCTGQVGEFLIEHIDEYMSQKAFKDKKLRLWPVHTIVVAMYGAGETRGKVSILNIETTTNQACCNLIIDPLKADYRFVYYWLRVNYQNLRRIGIGVRSNLNADQVLNFDFPDIELEEQQRIADCLYSIDNFISENNKTSYELYNIVRNIYDYWFMQFDFPNENSKPYRQSGGEMVHNDELDRDIPAGWAVASLNDTSLFKVIKTGIKKFDGSKRYLATADVNNTDIDDGNPIEYATRESRANMQPALLSVWFAKMKDSIKHLFISSAAEDFVEHTILSTGFFGLQCDENSFEYVSSYITNPLFEKWKNQISHGATQKAVNGDDLSKILIIEPPEEVLKLFHEKTKDIYQMLNNIQSENERLAQLRDYLLPLLMSGQVILNAETEED